MALFRVDFCGRGELADRQQKLAQMLSKLQKISEGKQTNRAFRGKFKFSRKSSPFKCQALFRKVGFSLST